MRYISLYILKPGIYFIALECGLKVIKTLSVEPTELEPLDGLVGLHWSRRDCKTRGDCRDHRDRWARWAHRARRARWDRPGDKHELGNDHPEAKFQHRKYINPLKIAKVRVIKSTRKCG